MHNERCSQTLPKKAQISIKKSSKTLCSVTKVFLAESSSAFCTWGTGLLKKKDSEATQRYTKQTSASKTNQTVGTACPFEVSAKLLSHAACNKASKLRQGPTAQALLRNIKYLACIGKNLESKVERMSCVECHCLTEAKKLSDL